MSYLKNIAKAGKAQVQENVKQTVKQNKESVKQTKPKRPRPQPPAIKKKQPIILNPNVKSIDDIPNTNIMTSGKLLGVRLRATKEIMLKEFAKYITNLLENEKK